MKALLIATLFTSNSLMNAQTSNYPSVLQMGIGKELGHEMYHHLGPSIPREVPWSLAFDRGINSRFALGFELMHKSAQKTVDDPANQSFFRSYYIRKNQAGVRFTFQLINSTRYNCYVGLTPGMQTWKYEISDAQFAPPIKPVTDFMDREQVTIKLHTSFRYFPVDQVGIGIEPTVKWHRIKGNSYWLKGVQLSLCLRGGGNNGLSYPGWK